MKTSNSYITIGSICCSLQPCCKCLHFVSASILQAPPFCASASILYRLYSSDVGRQPFLFRFCAPDKLLPPRRLAGSTSASLRCKLLQEHSCHFPPQRWHSQWRCLPQAPRRGNVFQSLCAFFTKEMAPKTYPLLFFRGRLLGREFNHRTPTA